MNRTVLRVPEPALLPGYTAALERGWSPNTMRPEAAQEQLAAIARDAAGFVAGLTDPEARGGPITLPDGSSAPRLPGRTFWVWDAADDAFCGSINLRWQAGTPALPPHVLGHIGYAIVPWQRRRGHATAALRALLPMARAEGLPYVDATTDEDNFASQRVLEANGGVLIGRLQPPPAMGKDVVLRYRFVLD
jgi:predicted acetyltransferase